VFSHCWLGDRKGIRPVKNWVLVCWWWRFDWSFTRLIAPAVTTTSITLSSNKIQNGYILVPANPGPPGKWPLKRRERTAYFQYRPQHWYQTVEAKGVMPLRLNVEKVAALWHLYSRFNYLLWKQQDSLDKYSKNFNINVNMQLWWNLFNHFTCSVLYTFHCHQILGLTYSLLLIVSINISKTYKIQQRNTVNPSHSQN